MTESGCLHPNSTNEQGCSDCGAVCTCEIYLVLLRHDEKCPLYADPLEQFKARASDWI